MDGPGRLLNGKSHSQCGASPYNFWQAEGGERGRFRIVSARLLASRGGSRFSAEPFMARVYIDKFSGSPMFSTEQGVGLKMANERKDVMLVQVFLKVILESNKIYLAGNTYFTPPDGVTLNITGVWDEASRRYLTRWEELLSEARAYWAYGRVDPTQFPGTVVPYSLGGKKILSMNEMCIVLCGKDSHQKLSFPNAPLPRELWKDLFWDPIRGP
jgi:hypothetical protein